MLSTCIVGECICLVPVTRDINYIKSKEFAMYYTMENISWEYHLKTIIAF